MRKTGTGRRIIAVIMAVLMLTGQTAAFAEESAWIGENFYIDSSEGFVSTAVTLDSGSEGYVVTNEDTYIWALCADLEDGGDQLKDFYEEYDDDAIEFILESTIVEYDEETDMKVTNGISWIGFSTYMDGEKYRGLTCMYEYSLAQMIFFSGESISEITRFMKHVHPASFSNNVSIDTEKTWTCGQCGKIGNTDQYCPVCGNHSPYWKCPNCGRTNDGNFCTGCSTQSPYYKKPVQEPKWASYSGKCTMTTGKAMPGTDCNYSVLGSKVSGCMGIEFTYQVSTVWSGSCGGKRFIMICSDENGWERLDTTFEYSNCGSMVTVTVEWDTPLTITAFGTARVHSDDSSFNFSHDLTYVKLKQ